MRKTIFAIAAGLSLIAAGAASAATARPAPIRAIRVVFRMFMSVPS